MGFRSVLNRAIEGCGLTPKEFYNSSEYRARLAQERKLQRELHQGSDDPQSLRKLALAYGPLQTYYVQGSVWRCQLRRIGPALVEFGTPLSFEAKRRAEIWALGDWLMKAAKQNLPDELKAIAADQDKYEKRAKSDIPGAKEIRENWTKAFEEEGYSDASERAIDMLAKLDQLDAAFHACKKLSRKDACGSIERQREFPNAENVFPAVFSMTDKDKPYPNCLGKAIMSAAFIELCGGHAISVNMGSCGTRSVAKLRAQSNLLFERFLKSHPALHYVFPNFADFCKRSRSLLRTLEQEPMFFHGAGGLYCPELDRVDILDTNNKQVVRAHFSKSLTRAMEDRISMTDVLPGLVTNSSSNARNIVTRQLMRSTQTMLGDLETLAQLAYQPTVTYRQLLDAVAELAHVIVITTDICPDGVEKRKLLADAEKRELAYLFQQFPKAKSPVVVPRHQEERKQLARVAIYSMLMLLKEQKRPKNRRRTRQDLYKLSKEATALQISREFRAVTANNPKLLQRIARVIVGSMLHRLYIRAERFEEFIGERLPQPVAGYGNCRWQFASHVLAHLAVVDDQWAEVFPILSRHCASAMIIHGHALTLLEKSHDHLAVIAARRVLWKNNSHIAKALKKELTANGINVEEGVKPWDRKITPRKKS